MSDILLGKIVGVFGIKGALKLVSYCQNPQDIINYPLFDEKGQEVALDIISTKKKAGSKNEVLHVMLNDIGDRNAAELIVGKKIFAKRQDFEELADGEFFYVDLIGLDVVDSSNNKLGVIKNIDDYGAGGVVEVEFLKEVRQKYDFLKMENFSFSDEIFPEVNIEKGFVVFELPEFMNTKKN